MGHIITDNLSDEADLEDKERGLYRRCNALLRTFHFCSDEVKTKLFTCYCSNVYLCGALGKPCTLPKKKMLFYG